jgi:dihydrofolate synthase / folylpolyglutamate synthase
MKLQSFDDVRAVLDKYFPPGSGVRENSIERMHTLLAFLGDPQEHLKIVHVAGTSGKTSTSYYAAALLQQAGYRVGLTVSPHTIEMNDRVQMHGVPLAEASFAADFGDYIELVIQSGLKPIYFEIMFGFALWEFARSDMHYAVVEVGIGGLLDTTNVLTSPDKVCIITDIGFDHMHLLGRTIPEIAAQKAGIIQARNVAFTYDQGSDVLGAIHDRSRAKQADVHIFSDADILPLDLPLFQQRNFSLALQAVRFICEHDGRRLSDDMIDAASRTLIPGRMETFAIDGKQIILDGAHNGQKMHALLESVRARYPEKPVVMLLGFVESPGADDRMKDCLAQCAAFAQHLIVTQFGGPEDAPHVSVPVGDILYTCRALGVKHVTAEVEPMRAFELTKQADEPIVVVAGSLYLLNHIRPLATRQTGA